MFCLYVHTQARTHTRTKPVEVPEQDSLRVLRGWPHPAMSFLTCNGQGDGSAESQGCFPLDAHRLECFGVAGVRFTATRPCDTLKRGSSVHALKQSSQPSVLQDIEPPPKLSPQQFGTASLHREKESRRTPPPACNRPLVSKTVPTQLLSLSLSLVYSSSLLPLGVYRGLSPSRAPHTFWSFGKDVKRHIAIPRRKGY